MNQKTGITEINLFIENDYTLYKGQTLAIIKNLGKKKAKGIYQTDKAEKAFYNLVVSGMKKYSKDFCGQDHEWSGLLTVPNRKLAAADLLDTYLENIEEMASKEKSKVVA